MPAGTRKAMGRTTSNYTDEERLEVLSRLLPEHQVFSLRNYSIKELEEILEVTMNEILDAADWIKVGETPG